MSYTLETSKLTLKTAQATKSELGYLISLLMNQRSDTYMTIAGAAQMDKDINTLVSSLHTINELIGTNTDIISEVEGK